MKCPNCSYENPPKGTKYNNCNKCGYKLSRPKVPKGYIVASFEQRFTNLAIDTIISIYIISEYIYHSLILPKVDELAESNLFVLRILTGFFINFIYYFIFETLFQKTPAKFITKTKVIKQNGLKPNTRTIARRTLYRFIPFEIFSEISLTWWHDRWIKTWVVKNKKRKKKSIWESNNNRAENPAKAVTFSQQ